MRYVPFPERYHSLLSCGAGAMLLQTARCEAENERSYLFLPPVEILEAEHLDELPALFRRIDDCRRQRKYVAGLLAYEAGAHFEPLRPSPPARFDRPLAWFGVYAKAHVFDHRTGRFEGNAPDEFLPLEPPGEGFSVGEVRPDFADAAYSAQVAAIQEYIRAGDVYQVNLTGKLRFEFSGSAIALFQELLRQQPVDYSAFLNLGESQILSLSPELFFRVQGRRILTRPMKGTAPRGRDLEEDRQIADSLRNDAKNRSENVMIADLLRNDLGRICEFGSVRAEELFAVEKYATLFQMTSAVSGELRAGVSAYDIFASLFPCGSVTGAPKVRAMEIIRELEPAPRGIYTGAIGFFAPGGEMAFNVPIRTVVLREGHGEMGVGSGIVIDSVAKDEFRECLLKAEFLTRRAPHFQLIESILWDYQYRLLRQHLQRLKASAEYFDFPFEHDAAVARLGSFERQLERGNRYKVRVLLNASGALSIERSAITGERALGKIMISPVRTWSGDRFLRHKTTHREFYDESFATARSQGYDDVLFLNERDEVTEGAISNLFVQTAGRWFTPPVSCGLLPGICRRHLLETNPAASEKVLHVEDLRSADAIYLCNAMRGLKKVTIE